MTQREQQQQQQQRGFSKSRLQSAFTHIKNEYYELFSESTWTQPDCEECMSETEKERMEI